MTNINIVEEGNMATFFVTASGCLGAKLVSTNGKPSIFSIIFRLFPTGGDRNDCAAFRTTPG